MSRFQTTRAWMTFDAAGARFAVDAELVVEVHEAVAPTRLPFAPPHVRGVASVGGRILPVVDLAGYAALDLDPRRPAPLLVVLRAGGGVIAIRAQRITASVPSYAVEPESAEGEATPTPVVARFQQGERAVRVIDPQRIELGHGLAFAEEAAAAALVGFAGAQPQREGADSERLLVVEAAGRALALEMEELLLVFPVCDVRALPHAPPPVRGMAQAQRRPVLLLDPFGEPGVHADSGYCVVVATRAGPVGMRVDSVRGVVRFQSARRRAREFTMDDAREEIVEYDGRWLEVRSGRIMLDEHIDAIAGLVPAGDGSPDGGLRQPRATRRFLTFQAAGRVYALEFERVRRVVEPGERHRLPGAVDAFDGVTDVDGGIVPIVDVRRALARSPDGPQGLAILVEAGGGSVALVVDEVQRIRKVPAEDVDPMSDALTAAVVRLDGALVPVLRPEGLLLGGRRAPGVRTAALPDRAPAALPSPSASPLARPAE